MLILQGGDFVKRDGMYHFFFAANLNLSFLPSVCIVNLMLYILVVNIR